MGFISKIINIKKNYLLEWQNALLEDPVNKLIMTENQLKTQTEIRVQNDLRIINESTGIIEKTVKADVFFDRLLLVEEKSFDLVRFEKYISLSGARPSDSYKEFQQNKQKAISFFLVRYFISFLDKSDKLKTDKGKLNQYQKFYDSLQPYYSIMNDENIDYIETKYNAYTRLIKTGQE